MSLKEEGERIIASEADFSDTARPRPRGRPRGKKKVEEPPFNYQRDETSIKGCVIVTKVTFGILCRLMKWDNITEQEANDLGEALDPVLQKRLPALAGWAEELALGMVLLGVLAPRLMEGPKEETVEEEVSTTGWKDEVEAPFTVVDPPIDRTPANASGHPTPKPKPASDTEW